MLPVLMLRIVCGLMLYASFCEPDTQPCVPRQTVPLQDLNTFSKDGIYDYNTMLIMEHLGVLVVAARDAIFALEINNISVKMAEVDWPATDKSECMRGHPNRELNCHNYIRTLHNVHSTTMFVCGSNAFDPLCDSLTYEGGQLKLMGKHLNGQRRASYLPFEGYASVMVGGDLYAATVVHGTSPGPMLMHTTEYYKGTRTKDGWMTDPVFVHIDFVDETDRDEYSISANDAKIYLVFSETEHHGMVRVSRVSRVRQADWGSSASPFWTSFQKATLDCSLPDENWTPVVQSAFLLMHENWKESLFYAVFTSPWDRVSTLCVYSMSSISKTLDSSQVYSPGSVSGPVRPMLTNGPLLIKEGALLSQIVVESVTALDGQRHDVMFIGTENGFIQKAVNHNGETFIIEEIQVYPTERIRTLHLLSVKGQLFVGSRVGVVQMPVSNCSRHVTCPDCILARDPYCAWNLSAKVCFPIRGLSSSPTASTAIQSLKEFFRCPKPDPVPVVDYRLVPGINMQLTCQATSNLAEVMWQFANETLNSTSKYSIHSQGLIILNTSELDAGLYTCNSSELINGTLYCRRVAAYRVQVDCCGSLNSVLDCFLGPTFLVPLVLLFMLCLTLVTFIIWTWRRRRYMVQQTDNTELIATSINLE
ncbi:semaphorin-4E-like [Hippocampus comes]|uniref:semaphorin-4E-like n=1 Tax=Hippocampus comes TaxID=109280 RepID=UPI00094E7A5F|nr:PREDICTED: semaphorin-4E-like [Hippocampus comes]